MKIENDWLENEMMVISNEIKQKRKKSPDTMICVRMFLVFSAIFFYTSAVDCKPNITHNARKAEGGGQLFICPDCRTNQWHASNTKDWQGNYYCRGCKKKLN